LLLTKRRLVLALVACLVLIGQRAWIPGTANAFGIYPAGSSGMDISYPACEDPLPAAPTTFAVIGVTGGRAYTMNPCLIKEFAWAKTAQVTPSFFMNLNAPSGSVAFEAKSGPKGNCAANDDMCLSYNFGWNAARLAYAAAQSQETSANMWWLDIETMNTWSDTNLPANAQVIQAAIDYLKSQNRTLGLYSTSKQWGDITGTSYSPGLPVWVAGAPDGQTAPTYCDASHSFGGGTVWLVQYPSGDTGGDDADYACGAAPVPAGQPTGFLATAVNPTTIQLTWTGPPSPVDSYSITTGVTTTVIKPPVTTYTIPGLTPGSYHCYAIAAQMGSFFSGWSSYSCVTTPTGP
jgi:Fibronectin type III domain